MKIKYIILLLVIFFAFNACSDDTEPVLDIPNSISLDQLEIGAITITDENAGEVVLTLKWNEAKPELNVITDYVVQIDRAGNDFKTAKILGSTDKLSYAIKGLDINDFVTKNFAHEPLLAERYDIRIATRVLGKDGITVILSETASNKQHIRVTTMNTVKDPLYIIGDALVGWNNAESAIGADLQVFFSDDSQAKNLTYTYTGFFKGGGTVQGVKFPTIADQKWSKTYGYSNGSIGFTYSDNMPAPASDGIYTLTVDTKELTASFAPYTGSATEQKKVGIIGDAANGWGAADDIIMTKVAKYVWIAKDVELKVGGLKFRADNAWTTNWGGVENKGDVKQELPYHINGGENIDIPVAGTYYLAINTLTGHHLIIPMADLPIKKN